LHGGAHISFQDVISMRRFLTLLAALAIAATLAVALVVVAPAAQLERAPPTAKANRMPVGLPVFSSDGKQLGKVLAEGIDEDDQPVLVAEIKQPLGLGSHTAAIPTYMFVRKSNQVILTITAKEVADRLSQRTQPYPAEGQ
jgi:PRC-barrel domain